jgi:phosphoribosylglycinamide formyltransferase-1
MVAIAAAFPNELIAVIGTRPDAPAIAKAQTMGLQVRVSDQPETVLDEIDLLCLAGYMRLLRPEALVNRTVLNIHPALLPKFGGPGMYGMHVHQAVIDAGESESGCTVHRVTEYYDEGEIVLQRRVPVLPTDTAASLAARVLEAEHIAYPDAIRKIREERSRQG